jgi:hypothetical protein
MIITMAKKPLIETNPYLKDPEKRRKAIITNVASNTSVETGRKVETIVRTLIRAERTPRLKTRQGSDR